MNDQSLKWLLEQRPSVTSIEVRGKEFYLREPTVIDRDKLDAVISSMDMSNLEIRTPLLQAVMCDQDGNKVAENECFDDVPAELVEPLIDKAKELFGISEHPTPGETD